MKVIRIKFQSDTNRTLTKLKMPHNKCGAFFFEVAEERLLITENFFQYIADSCHWIFPDFCFFL